MSFIVLYFEGADIKDNKELGFFIENFQGTHSVLQRSTIPRNKDFGVQEICTESCGTNCLDNSELPNFLLKVIKAECFAIEAEKCKILGNLMDKEVVNLDDHGCPKVRDIVHRNTWRNVELLESRISTQDPTSLCRA